MTEATSPLRTSGRAVKKSAVRNAPEIVLEGPDGNLYLSGDSNRTQDQHLGKLLISHERIGQWRALMQHRAAWLAAANIEFVFMIGPDKQSVYWPSIGVDAPDHRNSLLVFEGLNDVVWVDPVAALAAASPEPPVFPLNDSHYDARGAYIAYRELFSRLSNERTKALVEGEHFVFLPIEAAGDLGNKFLPYKTSVHQRIKRIKMSAKLIYNNGVAANGGMRIYFNPNGAGIGFLCGDSYSQNIFPFVAEHFQILVHLRSPIDAAFVQSVQPSTVIGMIAERFMLQEPVIPDEVPFEILFIRKLARGEINPSGLARSRTQLSYDKLPAAILAAVARHEALVDAVIANNSAESSQTRFAGDIFEGASNADVLVAAYLAWAHHRKLQEGWRKAYRILPEIIRQLFETECQNFD